VVAYCCTNAIDAEWHLLGTWEWCLDSARALLVWSWRDVSLAVSRDVWRVVLHLPVNLSAAAARCRTADGVDCADR
jgi:hypothetical protein